MLDDLRVEPGSAAALAARDSAGRLGTDKETAAARLQALVDTLAARQERLHAEDRRSVLLVLQGLDTSGKDGTIRRVFTGVNPLGLRVTSFKAPAGAELEHDYLWRIHAQLPRRGEIGIFNRSHYEDIVTASVLGIIDDAERERRAKHVRDFEEMLHDEGTTVVKVFLHLGRDEQRERLQARLDAPEKRWKFQPGDLETRKRWDDHMAAYEFAITATSTARAPWYVVPADRKWASSLAVSTLLVHTLEAMDPRFPPAAPDLDGIRVE